MELVKARRAGWAWRGPGEDWAVCWEGSSVASDWTAGCYCGTACTAQPSLLPAVCSHILSLTTALSQKLVHRLSGPVWHVWVSPDCGLDILVHTSGPADPDRTLDRWVGRWGVRWGQGWGAGGGNVYNIITEPGASLSVVSPVSSLCVEMTIHSWDTNTPPTAAIDKPIKCNPHNIHC